jgi:hypothetical protein
MILIIAWKSMKGVIHRLVSTSLSEQKIVIFIKKLANRISLSRREAYDNGRGFSDKAYFSCRNR